MNIFFFTSCLCFFFVWIYNSAALVNKLFLRDKNSLLAKVYLYEVVMDAVGIVNEVFSIKSERLF